MRILIADDDPVCCRLLERTLAGWGHEVVVTHDGLSAWDRLAAADAPLMAVLDWNMPGLSGTEVCRRVHAQRRSPQPFLVLLTGNCGKANLLTGLASGADDYITKPFDAEELRARLNVGLRLLECQCGLAERVRELESALAQIKQLQGLLPICMYCKKIRVDRDYWQQVEAYLARHTDARFSHGICPDCYVGVVQPEVERVHRDSCPAVRTP